MYEYLPIEQAKPGDLVECLDNYSHAFTKGRIYQVRRVNGRYGDIEVVEDDNGSKTNGWDPKFFKLIKSKPMINAQIGDTVICIAPCVGNLVGQVDVLQSANKIHEVFVLSNGTHLNHFSITHRVLCKTKALLKRNLAFYKRSGTPWTEEEYHNIVKYCGYETDSGISNYAYHKFIFDDGSPHRFMYMWTKQEKTMNFNNCTQVAYEDIFNPQRVAIVTKFVHGHPVNSRIIPCYKEHFWVLFNNPNGPAYRHEIGESCEWEDILINTGIPITQNPCYEVPLVAESSIESQSKENTMNDLQQILSQIFGTEKPTTDYTKRPQLLVVVYSLDGKKVGTTTANSVEQVTSEVKRNPQLWGCKVLTYKLNKELFVDVPVSIEKARVASESEAE